MADVPWSLKASPSDNGTGRSFKSRPSENGAGRSFKAEGNKSFFKPRASENGTTRSFRDIGSESIARLKHVLAVDDEEEVERLKQKKKGFSIDAYALREQPATFAGSIISLLVLIATLVYMAYVLYQAITSPPSQKADIYWTIGAGPFPAKVLCKSPGGCYISNLLSTQWATDIANSVDAAQQGCIKLDYNQQYIINVTFSNSPLDGFQVIYNASQTDPAVPMGFGMLIESSANCDGGPSCVDGVLTVQSPIGPGFSQLTYVETHNETASAAAALRREWFVGKFSDEGSIVQGSSPCLSSLPQALLTDHNMQQARLRFNTFYTVQTISRESVLLVLFGAVGGAFSIFLQAGSLILLVVSVWMSFAAQRQLSVAGKMTAKVTPSNSQTARAPEPSNACTPAAPIHTQLSKKEAADDDAFEQWRAERDRSKTGCEQPAPFSTAADITPPPHITPLTADVTPSTADVTLPTADVTPAADVTVTPPLITRPDITPPDLPPPPMKRPVSAYPAITPSALTPPAITRPVSASADITRRDITPPDVTPPDITPPAIAFPDIAPPVIAPAEAKLKSMASMTDREV